MSGRLFLRCVDGRGGSEEPPPPLPPPPPAYPTCKHSALGVGDSQGWEWLMQKTWNSVPTNEVVVWATIAHGPAKVRRSPASRLSFGLRRVRMPAEGCLGCRRKAALVAGFDSRRCDETHSGDAFRAASSDGHILPSGGLPESQAIFDRVCVLRLSLIVARRVAKTDVLSEGLSGARASLVAKTRLFQQAWAMNTPRRLLSPLIGSIR